METKRIFGSCLDSKEVFSVLGKAEEKWNLEYFFCTGKCEGTGGGESYHAFMAIGYPNCKKILFSSRK